MTQQFGPLARRPGSSDVPAHDHDATEIGGTFNFIRVLAALIDGDLNVSGFIRTGEEGNRIEIRPAGGSLVSSITLFTGEEFSSNEPFIESQDLGGGVWGLKLVGPVDSDVVQALLKSNGEFDVQAATDIIFKIGGPAVEAARIVATGLRLIDGSAANPSLAKANAPTDGLFFDVGAIGAAIAGIEIARIIEDGLTVGDQSDADPLLMGTKYTFFGDQDTYIVRSGADEISIVLGGTTVLQMSRPTSEISRFNFPTAASTFIDAYRTGSTDRLVLRANDRINSPDIYAITTGTAANVHIESDGDIIRSTSTLRSKPGWQFVDEDELAELEMPVPITWVQEVLPSEDDPHKNPEVQTMLGFGTEHVEAMLPAAVQDRDPNTGEPENYDVRSLVAVLSAKVKRLEQRIEQLEAERSST